MIEIEKNIKSLSELQNFCENSSFRYNRITEIKSIIESLNQSPKFLQILEEVKNSEKNEVKLLISKEIQEIENISENLEKSLSTDEYQAYDLLTKLENIRISID